jgi:hypothetical protein
MMNRKRILKYLIIPALISTSLLLSCEDVINVDLKSVAPRIVIEGSLSNLSDSVIIMLHKSTDYFTPSGIIPINDAEVSITDSAGISHQLVNIADGIYAAGDIHSKPGDIFNLGVTEAGVTYTANSVMPVLVNLETVTIDKNPNHPDEDRINVLINDPAGIANYYMFEVFRNDTLLNKGNHFILYTDKYFDGKSTWLEISARRLGDIKFHPGDSIKVRLLNIEKTMYEYFDILRSITDEMQILSAATPSNPPNNISNDALGYFAVWSVSEMTIIMN